jgi:FkbM family methyltransferase
MKQLVKRILNAFFMKTISYRVIHNQLAVDSDMEVWKSLKAKGFNPFSIVDVGAAQGGWTTQMLEIFPGAKYLMIDPLKENESALKVVAKKKSNVNYWLGAVGRTSGELEMHVHGEQTSMYASEWGGGTRRVPMNTLDALVKEMPGGCVDGLKLDVQGAELEVLAGASEMLKRCKVVQVEVSFRRVYEKAPLAHEIIKFFAERGFRIFDIASVIKRGNDRGLLQADLFFVADDQLFKPETWDA